MTPILPTGIPGQTPPLPVGTATVVTVLQQAIDAAAADLAKLDAGTPLDAQVVADPVRNTVLVQTDLGQLTLRGAGMAALPPGTTLVLQLVTAGAQPTFRVVAMNGQPLPGAGQPGTGQNGIGQNGMGQPGKSLGLPPTGPSVAAGGANALAAGTGQRGAATMGVGAVGTGPQPGTLAGIPAQILRSGGATPGLGPDPLPPGTALIVRIVQIGPAPTGAGPAESDPPAEPQSAKSPALPGAPAIDAGARDDPAPPPPTPADPTPGRATLHGTVAANSHAGRPLIQTEAGLIALEALDLPAGADVTLDVVRVPPPPPSAAADDAPGPAATAWQALNEALAVLQKADPAAAEQLAARLPQLNARLAASLASFAIAVQSGGDLKALIGGDAVKALDKAGRRDLLKRMAERAEDSSPAGDAPAVGDWQTMTVPLMAANGQLDPVRLTVRRAPPDDDDSQRGGGTEGIRFLVDVDLSTTGPLQLDGLVKRQTKRFEMIVRTTRRLPEAWRHDMNALFAEALHELKLDGSIGFQVAERFPGPQPGQAVGPVEGWVI